MTDGSQPQIRGGGPGPQEFRVYSIPNKMKTVILKNSAEEAAVLVAVTRTLLETLIEEKPIAFYELVAKCRDPNHEFSGSTGADLSKTSLVSPDGSIHNSIRNVVLSAVTGDGLDMVLGSPIK